jgi:hypothetical protein
MTLQPIPLPGLALPEDPPGIVAINGQCSMQTEADRRHRRLRRPDRELCPGRWACGSYGHGEPNCNGSCLPGRGFQSLWILHAPGQALPAPGRGR